MPSRNNSTALAGDRTSRPPKPPLVCRTCLRCRSKKVKCDATQPRCAPCALAEVECSYPPDARRSARTSKSDVRELRQELSVLRRIVQERGIQVPATGDPVSSTEARDGNIVFERANDAQRQFQSLPHLVQASDVSPSPQVDLSQPQEHIRATPPHNSQASPNGLDYNQDVAPGSIGVSVNSQNWADGNDTFFQGPLSSEAHIAGAMSEDGQVHVHGVTSTLYQPAAVQTIGENQSKFEEESGIRAQLAMEQLISNAAIQRQREIAKLSSPNLQSKMDFDGLEAEVAIHLLDLHWNRHHLGYLYTYRPAVMDSFMNGGLHANKLLLNAIYYASSLFSDRLSLRADPQDPQTQGDQFYYRFKQLLVDEIDKPSIPSACALLLCGSSLVSHGKQSAGWLLCGIAYRMITELGCHLNIQTHSSANTENSRSTLMDREIRKRLYWGAFIMDKFQSLYLGRPPALRPAEARVSKSLYDTYEELELWSPYIDPKATTILDIPAYQPRPTYAVSTLQSLSKLAEIASHIVDSFYSIESISMPKEIVLQKKLSLGNDLDEWQKYLPQHLHFDPNSNPTPPPHQITPHTTYWTLLILLERPFLSTGHLSSIFDKNSQAIGAQKCTTAALKIWNLVKAYKIAFTLRRAPYLLSYAIYSAVLVILHQTDEDNTRFLECMPFFWSALLDLQQGCNSGLKKPLTILKALMQKLGKDLPYWVSIEEERRHGALGTENMGFGADINGIEHRGGQFVVEHGVDMPGLEFLHDANLDIWTNSQWLDTIASEQGLTDDSMYGLFTSR